MWENRKFLLFAIPLCAYLLTSFFSCSYAAASSHIIHNCWMLLVHWHTFYVYIFFPKTTPVPLSLWAKFFPHFTWKHDSYNNKSQWILFKVMRQPFLFSFRDIFIVFPLEIFIWKLFHTQSKFLSFFWMKLINFLLKKLMHKSFFIYHRLSSLVCQKNKFSFTKKLFFTHKSLLKKKLF